MGLKSVRFQKLLKGVNYNWFQHCLFEFNLHHYNGACCTAARVFEGMCGREEGGGGGGGGGVVGGLVRLMGMRAGSSIHSLIHSFAQLKAALKCGIHVVLYGWTLVERDAF